MKRLLFWAMFLTVVSACGRVEEQRANKTETGTAVAYGGPSEKRKPNPYMKKGEGQDTATTMDGGE